MDAQIIKKYQLWLSFSYKESKHIEMLHYCMGGVQVEIYGLSLQDIKSLRIALDELETNILSSQKPALAITVDGKKKLTLKKSNIKKLKAYMDTVGKDP